MHSLRFCPFFAAALGKKGGLSPQDPSRERTRTTVKTSLQGRIRIAWLLLATLMPFFAVKAIHHHEVVPSAICQTTDAGQSQSACGDDSCPICHFSLEPFTPGESLTLSVTLSFIHHEPGTLREPLFGQPVASYNLRAPPAC